MREPRVFLVGLALAVLSGATAAPAGAQVIAGRGFGESYVSFQDVNGNGVLDCLEPVTLRVAYFDPASDTATGSITGRMVAPFAGAGGLSFIPGSVEIDRLFSVGDCVATIVTGNDPSDVEATVDFACGPSRPASGQGAPGGNVVAFLYRAAFSSSQPSFTAVTHGTTSDGLDAAPQLQVSGNIGAVCTTSGGAPNVAVAKTAAGTGVPGSTLLYAIAATDQGGLGAGRAAADRRDPREHGLRRRRLVARDGSARQRPRAAAARRGRRRRSWRRGRAAASRRRRRWPWIRRWRRRSSGTARRRCRGTASITP
jgi:hypothetical protein